MEWLTAAPLIGSLITLLLGFLGLFAPAAASSFTSMEPVGLLGRSEIRATFGGLFVALGLCGLVAQSALVFFVIGTAWLGAALGRFFSVFVDGSRSARNIAAAVFEAAVGVMLVVSWLSGG